MFPPKGLPHIAVGLTCLAAAVCLQPGSVHAQTYAGLSQGPFTAQNSSATTSTLTIPITANLALNERLIVVVSCDPTNNTPTLTDPNGNAYRQDANTTNTGNVELFVYSALMTAPLTSGQAVTINFGTTGFPVAKAAFAASYKGLLQATNALDRRATSSADNVTAQTATLPTATRGANELVLDILAMEGTRADATTVGAATSNPAPASLSVEGTSVGVAASNVALVVGHRQVSAVGSYSAAFTWPASTGNRSVVAAVLTYYAGPSQLEFVAPVGIPTFTAQATNANPCNGPFTLRLLNAYGAEVPPTANTRVSVTSASPSDRLWANDPTCAGAGATTTNVTFPAGSITQQSIYLRDSRRSTPTWTLTATRATGNTVSAATKAYTVNAGTPTRALVVLPNQLFTEGTGVTGTPSTQRTFSTFPFSLVVVDAWNNRAVTHVDLDADDRTVTFSGLLGSPTYSFTGPGACAAGCTGNPLTVHFTGGQSLGTLTARANTVQVNARITAALTLPTGPVALNGPASSAFSIQAAAPRVTIQPPTVGYAAKAGGTVVVRVENLGSTPVTSVSIARPTGWSLVSGTSNVASCNTASVNATNVVFTCAPSLAAGATADFTVTNTGGLYPNLSADTSYAFNVAVVAAVTTNAVVNFDVLMPLAPPVLPVATRDSAPGTRPSLYWTDTDANSAGTALTGARMSGGGLVVRGNTRPIDGVVYAAGAALGTSTVICGSTAGSCVEPATVAESPGATLYTFYNRDQQLPPAGPIYSAGVAITLPAKPADTTPDTVVLMTNSAFALKTPAVRQGNAASKGFAVLPMQNRGLFFIRTDGLEQRRAELLNATIQRRPSLGTLSTNEQRVFAGDTGGTFYRVDPATPGEATSSYAVGQPVGSNVNSILASQFLPTKPTATVQLSSLYSTDIMVFGTNAAANNTVRAVKPTPGAPLPEYWSFTLPSSSDSIRTDPYVDYERGWLLFPVSTGSGGLLGFDLSSAAGTVTPAPQPPSWTNRKALPGVLLTSQPRKVAGTYVVGAQAGTTGLVYAVDPINATLPAGSASLDLAPEGPLKAVLPYGTNGAFYVTTNGRLGRVTIGTAPLSVTRDTTFTTWVSPTNVIGGATTFPSRNALYVSATRCAPTCTAAVIRLNLTTGAEEGFRLLEGTSVSEVAFETYDGVMFVGTDTGSIWVIPTF